MMVPLPAILLAGALMYVMVFLPITILMYAFLRFGPKYKASIWRLLFAALVFAIVAIGIELVKHEIYGNGYEETRLFSHSNLLKYLVIFAAQVLVFKIIASKASDEHIPWRTWALMFLVADVAILAFLNSPLYLRYQLWSSF